MSASARGGGELSHLSCSLVSTLCCLSCHLVCRLVRAAGERVVVGGGILGGAEDGDDDDDPLAFLQLGGGGGGSSSDEAEEEEAGIDDGEDDDEGPQGPGNVWGPAAVTHPAAELGAPRRRGGRAAVVVACYPGKGRMCHPDGSCSW